MANVVAWILVAHVAGMLAWVGGLWMALAVATAPAHEGEQGLQARLAQRGLRAVAHPGAAVVVLTGAGLMAMLPGVRMAAWLHVKLLGVVLLIVLDLLLTVRVRRLPQARITAASARALRAGVAALVLLILVMVLVKPF